LSWREARLELADLELDDDVAQLLHVEEEQVDREVVAVDLEAHLAAHESEAPTELGEGLLDPVHERLLELALGDGAAEAEEVEDEGILREVPGELGLARIETVGEKGGSCE